MPLVSIVVRSYRRPAALLELVGRLRTQRHPSFEIVVVEQTGDPELEVTLERLGEPRLRVLKRPPLGAPGARNEGVRHATGEIVVLIDDDDLPIGENWVTAHVANYDDPKCVGVCGRLSSSEGNCAPPRFPRIIRWLSFQHTVFKDPRTFAFGSLRKSGIAFLIGSNTSFRRSMTDRIGGWDEGVPMGEEQSFFFRWAQARRPDEYMVYDPTPVIWRRTDLPGGLNRRTAPDWYRRELEGRVIYYHAVVAHYFPWRFRILYPLFLLRMIQQVIVWIWDADNRNRRFSERLTSTVGTIYALPRVLWVSGWRLPRSRIKRVLRLHE